MHATKQEASHIHSHAATIQQATHTLQQLQQTIDQLQTQIASKADVRWLSRKAEQAGVDAALAQLADETSQELASVGHQLNVVEHELAGLKSAYSHLEQRLSVAVRFVEWYSDMHLPSGSPFPGGINNRTPPVVAPLPQAGPPLPHVTPFTQPPATHNDSTPPTRRMT
eukprot:TRINITY_DN6951_c0_g1_i2.p1 TRINITY_DN6951_c0_g1~~TRINITY_DN6951_c0_g1_i2.p1  ORF type:complete len:168 (-),score=36.03 TRINITY_DN6951_c0_g1_i2:388-891(-)